MLIRTFRAQLKEFCFSKFGNNCSEHDIITNNNLHVQNSNIKFGIVPILPISYTWSICRQKQHINGENSSKQAYKIWHKNFSAITKCHIFGVWSFFSRTLYLYMFLVQWIAQSVSAVSVRQLGLLLCHCITECLTNRSTFVELFQFRLGPLLQAHDVFTDFLYKYVLDLDQSLIAVM